MASDHPEQNEADQDNTEQNDLQQIEDLKIQESSYKQVWLQLSYILLSQNNTLLKSNFATCQLATVLDRKAYFVKSILI